ncbi:hypothetical protein MtrunA17_Chr2g0315471 [Medicago truncatula]|uniref:Uncharacterized protein n=1 Tax=Medicago truncatula TaxID=3880 RepID=A0A396JF56_MEDTR|nr:hypothetical protein MtrunA17_Chr2g0315471 [Medicago truncatula]
MQSLVSNFIQSQLTAEITYCSDCYPVRSRLLLPSHHNSLYITRKGKYTTHLR